MDEVLKVLKKYTYLIKFLILIWVVFFIYMKIKNQWQEFSPDQFDFISKPGNQTYWILLSILLMPINLGIESWKWKFIASKIEKVSFFQALSGVLSGLSLGFITPHALGDYAGRIWQLKTSGRLKAIGGLMVGRIMQFLATLLFGLIGILLSPSFNGLSLILSYLVGIIIIIILLVRPAYFMKVFEMSFLKRFRVYFRIIQVFSNRDKWSIFLISVLRYLVFSTQFVLLMFATGVGDSLLLLFSGASFIFLAKSTVPTFNFLSDLGIREAAAIFYFSQIGETVIPVVIASIILWTINILIPAIIGTGFVWSLKIVRSS